MSHPTRLDDSPSIPQNLDEASQQEIVDRLPGGGWGDVTDSILTMDDAIYDLGPIVSHLLTIPRGTRLTWDEIEALGLANQREG